MKSKIGDAEGGAHLGRRLVGLIAAIGALLVAFGSARGGIDALVHAVGIHHTPAPAPNPFDAPSAEGARGEAFLAIAAVCVWMAVFVLRRLRPPSPTTAGSATGPDAIPRTAPSRHKVFDFVVAPLMAVFFAGSFVLFSTVAISGLSANARSAYVQAHGLRRAAVVDKVQNFPTTDKGVTHYTATLNVTVKSPAGGGRNAVVYYPDQAQAEPGSATTVLLDPQQPAYAELPGHPYQNSGPWGPLFLFAVAAAVAVVTVMFSLVFIAKVLRRPMWTLAPGRLGKQLARSYGLRKRSGLGKWPTRTR